MSEELQSAVARVEGEPRAEGFFAVGDPAKILAEASEQLDLLLVGPRGYGPLHSVVVGGVAGRVVRQAACAVIVLPRSAGHVEEDSLFAEAVPPFTGSGVTGDASNACGATTATRLTAPRCMPAMASAEREERLAGVYRQLAASERRHAARWAGQLERLGAGRPEERPGRRARTLAWLAGRFGAALLLPTLAAREQSDRRRYAIQPEAGDELREEERRSGGRGSDRRLRGRDSRGFHGRLMGEASGSRWYARLGCPPA